MKNNSTSGFQLCHNSVSQSQRIDNPVDQSKLEMHAADAKRGKTPEGESRLALDTFDRMKKWRQFVKPIV